MLRSDFNQFPSSQSITAHRTLLHHAQNIQCVSTKYCTLAYSAPRCNFSSTTTRKTPAHASINALITVQCTNMGNNERTHTHPHSLPVLMPLMGVLTACLYCVDRFAYFQNSRKQAKKTGFKNFPPRLPCKTFSLLVSKLCSPCLYRHTLLLFIETRRSNGGARV